MCGIIGIKAFNSEGKHLLSHIDKAVSLLHHRGPDSQAVFNYENIALGHARLAVIDTSSTADQPMHDATGQYTIVFNGEIYNYKECRQILENKGYTFKSDSDTEVLLNLYIHEGKECLNRINGCFAFAIQHKKDNSLFIARDRFGINPLVFYRNKNVFAFASEIKAILPFVSSKEIDSEALYTFFQLNYIPGPKTIFKGITKLLPGHYIEIKGHELSIRQYYFLEKKTTPGDLSFENAGIKLMELLHEAVKSRLISDVPLGSFLSGGIDSSLIAGIASQHTTNLNTFSIGFKDEPFFDETHYANLVAKRFNTKHTVFSLSNKDLFEHIFDILDHFDEPFADSSAIPVYILSKHAQKNMTVALSGDGADEMFAGYNKHAAHFQASQKSLTNSAIKRLAKISNRLPQSRNSNFSNKIRQISRYAQGIHLSQKERYWKWCSVMDDVMASEIIHNKIDKQTYNDFRQPLISAINSDDINEILLSDLNMVLPYDMLMKVDLMSMAHSLEVRTPFLDHRIVEFAMSLPGEFKTNGKAKKMILHETFREFLPKELYNRPKHGFEVPLLKWFRNELQTLVKSTLIENPVSILNKDVLNKLYKKLNSSNPGDSTANIWAVLTFSHWYRKYFE
ncbi:MAG: asparagine synthase (glutamine-hydrolyzing) [Marinilabiliales bacterium]|nr:MAG: asparagine synthase (glutamine-hydrolyzing) [Marinilabiliales bacterium]